MLFRVLHLLAHLLDEDLHVDRAARGLEVLGFRGERVGFAVELLHEETEPPSGGLAAADGAARLRDVAGEPLELLVGVEPLEQKRQLLLEPLVVDARGQLRDALVESRAGARAHFGQARAHGRNERLEPGAALPEELAQPRAFALASRDQLGERGREHFARRRQELLARPAILAQHARPPQYLERAHRCSRLAQRTHHGVHGGQHALERLFVDFKCTAGRLWAPPGDGAVDLATAQLPHEVRAQLALVAAQLVRQAEGSHEGWVVGSAMHAYELTPWPAGGAAREAGHARAC